MKLFLFLIILFSIDFLAKIIPIEAIGNSNKSNKLCLFIKQVETFNNSKSGSEVIIYLSKLDKSIFAASSALIF